MNLIKAASKYFAIGARILDGGNVFLTLNLCAMVMESSAAKEARTAPTD